MTANVFSPLTVGTCRGCAYPLFGLPENRCPECGRTFDPADPRTMNMGRPVGRFAALLMRAPGLPMHIATAIGIAGAFAAFSAPWPYFDLAIRAYHFWLALAVVWVLRLIAFVITSMIHRQPVLRSSAAKWRRWAIAPVLALATSGLLYINAPLRLTLVLSLPALNGAAAEAPPAGQAPGADRWIGLFPARSPKRVAGGFEFEVRDAGFLSRCGIGRYDKPPVDSELTEYRWILGDWYAWRRSDWYFRVLAPANRP